METPILDADDVLDWITSLTYREKYVLAQDLSDCFEGVPLLALIGGNTYVDEALEIVTRVYHTSPYDRDKIKDALKLAKVCAG